MFNYFTKKNLVWNESEIFLTDNFEERKKTAFRCSLSRSKKFRARASNGCCCCCVNGGTVNELNTDIRKGDSKYQ